MDKPELGPTEFVNIFCSQLAKADKGMRTMSVFYLWEDKRDGSVEDRFKADVVEFNEYRRLFQ